MAFLEGLLGGGDPYALYGDLLTDKQRAALRDQQMGQGLLRMAGAFAEAAKPSLMPTGGIGSALGRAAGALAGHEDEGLKSLATAGQLRKLQQEMEWQKKLGPELYEFWRRKNGLPPTNPGTAPTTPPGPSTAGPITPPGPGGGPNAPPAVPPPPATPATPDLSELWRIPNDMPGLAAGGKQADAGGGPLDEVIRQTASGYDDGYGLLAQPASYGGGPGPLAMPAHYGGATNGGLPFRLAATSSNPGAAGGAAGDILDTVVAPLESGNRNVHQQVVSPNVSTAQGYYQITNSTWRDVAPKAGVDLDQYPTAMTAPKEVQKQVASELYNQRGIQPWAQFNPAIARAVGWQGQSARGERPADIVLPSGGGGGGDALSALLAMAGMGGDSGGDSDPLAQLAQMTGGGGVPRAVPATYEGGGESLPLQQAAALAHLNYGATGALGDPSKPGWAQENLTSIQAPGGARFQVNKNAAPDFEGFLKDLSAMGYKIDPKASGGYANRNITGGNTLSEHAYGTAIDINSNVNLYTKDGRKVTNLPPEVGDLAARHNLEWGGNWTDPVDTMHFQWRPPGAGGQDTVISSGRGVPANMLQRAQYSPGGATGATSGATAAAPAIPGVSGVIPGTDKTPEQVAALNALLKMSGMKSPLSDLLESYYKSPGYLGEVARTEAEQRKKIDLQYGPQIKAAETEAELNAKLKLEPQLQADIERAKNDPKLAYDEKKAIIERKSDEIRQNRDSTNKIIQDLLKDNMTIVDGKIVPLPDAQRIRTQNQQMLTAAQEEERAKNTLTDATVIGPDGRRTTQRMPVYEHNQRLKAQNAPGAASGGPRPGDIVGTPIVTETEKAIGTNAAAAFGKQRDAAQVAAQQIKVNNESLRLLDSGIYTGWDANLALNLSRVFGIGGKDDKERIQNTQLFTLQRMHDAAEAVRAQPGSASDKDLAFANKMAIDNTLDAETIRQGLEIYNRYNLEKIREHNVNARGIDPSVTAGIRQTVDEPPTYTRQQGQTPGGNRFSRPPGR